MDDFVDEIELLLGQSSPMEVSIFPYLSPPMEAHVEPTIPLATLNLDINNSFDPLKPTPRHSSIATSLNGLNCGSMCPFPLPSQPLFTEGPANFIPSGDPLDPNWEAIGAFLAGQVRPSPNSGDRIFPCVLCGVEFPNAQALGGHMSSHSKVRKENNAAPKKVRSKKASSAMAEPSRASKKGKGMERKEMKQPNHMNN